MKRVFLAGLLLLAPAVIARMDAQAKSAPAAPVAPKSTKSRVYSAAQAVRGEEVYMSNCVSCHPPATYKGAVFLNWQGKSLFDLYDFLTEKMPKNDPGSLTPKEYIDVMAYLLKINAMPAGRTDLASTPAALKGVTINLLPDKVKFAPVH
jgi:mono/diheme cytochrome c family protein